MDIRFRLAPPERPLPFDLTEKRFLSALTRKSPDIDMPELRSTRDYEAALEVFRTTLRNYVDSWISTGISNDQSEDLSERGHLRGEWVREPATLYNRRKLNALDSITTTVLEMLRSEFQLHSTAAGLELVFSPYSPKWEHEPLKGFGERMAKRFFTWFVASDLRNRLVKCLRCGDYDVRKKLFYKRGTFCRGCRQRIGAEEAMRKERLGRQQRREYALSLALKAWQGEFEIKDLNLRRRLAKEVNIHLPTRDHIKSNWVSRQLKLGLSKL